MSPYWSYALTALGVAGIFLAGSKKRIGWALGLAAQPLWIVYAVVTEQWGFILSGLVYGGVYLRNWLKWRREARRPDTVPSKSHTWHVPAWRTHREQVQYATGQHAVASAVKPPRATVNPDRCDKRTGYHSTPHRGCILR